MATCPSLTTYNLQFAILYNNKKKLNKTFFCSDFISVVPLCMCITQFLPACYLKEHIPCHGGHPSEGLVALIRRCHLLGAGIDLAWKEQRSDSTATKIRALQSPGKETHSPHLSLHINVRTIMHTHIHKVKKSSRSECMRAASACQCTSG